MFSNGQYIICPFGIYQKGQIIYTLFNTGFTLSPMHVHISYLKLN